MKLIVSLILTVASYTVHAQSVDGIIQVTVANYNEMRSAERGTALGELNNLFESEMGTVAGTADAIASFYNNTQTLANDECNPEFSAGNNVTTTSACRGNAQCEEDYTNAVTNMNHARMLLERIKCLYENTKNYTNSAIALGDNLSGMTGHAAIAWQRERVKINASFANFKQTYDTKYKEFIGILKDALIEFETCEATHANSPGWFQRVGFIYFDMMKARYKRND
jgi:hypothetical protein